MFFYHTPENIADREKTPFYTGSVICFMKWPFAGLLSPETSGLFTQILKPALKLRAGNIISECAITSWVRYVEFFKRA